MVPFVGSLLRGIGIGFAIAAPVGPIGLLCIRRSLRDGAMMGLATGLGAATADAFYGFVVAFGFGTISKLLLSQAVLLRIGGGLLLLWLGISSLRVAWRNLPALPSGEVTARGLLGAYGETFALTLANPATIFAFVAVLAALSGPDAGVVGGATLVVGVFFGSVLWWMLLVTIVTHLRRSLPPMALRWIEITSGAVLIVFGVVAILMGLNAV